MPFNADSVTVAVVFHAHISQLVSTPQSSCLGIPIEIACLLFAGNLSRPPFYNSCRKTSDDISCHLGVLIIELRDTISSACNSGSRSYGVHGGCPLFRDSSQPKSLARFRHVGKKDACIDSDIIGIMTPTMRATSGHHPMYP
jgi:hypothetical protein